MGFLPNGHISPTHYRDILDGLEVEDIIFSPYDGQQQVVPLEDILWYLDWIMADKLMK
jgi:hypothetical protein